MKNRIYVCHTFYHVYVTFLKELSLPKEEQGKASLILSKMSIDYSELKERLAAIDYFENIYEYDEKRESYFDGLEKFKKNQGNIVSNMISRIIFTKKFSKLQEPFVPVDFREYKDIYVYCDSDPIGYYLNGHKIYYHAIEDGLNALVHFDAARYDNRGSFPLKAFFSKKLNLIFVQNGYGKYCIDCEVNDIESIPNPCPYYVEIPRQPLVDRLTREDKELILKAFVRNKDDLDKQLSNVAGRDKKVLILTEPLCDFETRERIFKDIADMYKDEYTVFFKPHPRDELDYRTLFSEYPQFDASLPMEMLNFFDGLHFDKVVGVLTETKAIKFADEKIRLGADFMDKYEDPLIHRQNEQVH